LPERKPRLSYYGDDLTGSTDALEALVHAGLKAVLFPGIPDEKVFARFSDYEAFGIAGASRSAPPDWMNEHLRRDLAWLKTLGAEICHYKVCSTFDSSPKLGSIGRAIEIGRDVFGARAVPVVVGVPQLARYTSFGNLFAAYRGDVFRIDRHPVMSRHPVTPMDEADLRLHLARQTELRSELVDNRRIVSDDAEAEADKALAGNPGILMLDVDDAETQRAAGLLLVRLAAMGHVFVVGSSGVEYALLQAWKQRKAPEFAPLPRSDRIAVVSGSVSPTTERQIKAAGELGFDSIAIDPLALATKGEAEVANAVSRGLKVLEQGRSVILFTAQGPDSSRSTEIDEVPGGRAAIGSGLGRILNQIRGRAKLSRVCVSGGDTSSHSIPELGIAALTVRMPLKNAPGSPLCTAHGSDGATFEVCFKGGQLGNDTYFASIRDGDSA
jgi:uncharacterized protein YgbK (DUF1537 family)